MADSWELDLQAGIRAALAADAGVAALVGARIYDTPPDSPTYPFIRFGDLSMQPNDTDGTLGALITVSIEAHSRSLSGSVEAKRILGAVRAALHRQETGVTLANFSLIELIERTSLTRRDSSGESFVGVAVYRADLSP